MGGMTWTKEEEAYFWLHLVPQASKIHSKNARPGPGQKSWSDLAVLMDSHMREVYKRHPGFGKNKNPVPRRYSDTSMFEHYLSNLEPKRYSPNAVAYIRQYEKLYGKLSGKDRQDQEKKFEASKTNSRALAKDGPPITLAESPGRRGSNRRANRNHRASQSSGTEASGDRDILPGQTIPSPTQPPSIGADNDGPMLSSQGPGSKPGPRHESFRSSIAANNAPRSASSPMSMLARAALNRSRLPQDRFVNSSRLIPDAPVNAHAASGSTEVNRMDVDKSERSGQVGNEENNPNHARLDPPRLPPISRASFAMSSRPILPPLEPQVSTSLEGSAERRGHSEYPHDRHYQRPSEQRHQYPSENRDEHSYQHPPEHHHQYRYEHQYQQPYQSASEFGRDRSFTDGTFRVNNFGMVERRRPVSRFDPQYEEYEAWVQGREPPGRSYDVSLRHNQRSPAPRADTVRPPTESRVNVRSPHRTSAITVEEPSPSRHRRTPTQPGQPLPSLGKTRGATKQSGSKGGVKRRAHSPARGPAKIAKKGPKSLP